MNKPSDSKAVTKSGAPRKRAPGAGRPVEGKGRAGSVRVGPEARALLEDLQGVLDVPGARAPSLADAVEVAARMALDVVLGEDPRRWLPGG